METITPYPQPTQQLPAPTDESSAITILPPRDPMEMGEYARTLLELPEKDPKTGLSNAKRLAAAMIAGRELGIPAMVSATEIHVIKGRPTLSATLQRACVLKSNKCKWFKVQTYQEVNGELCARAEAERIDGVKMQYVCKLSDFKHLLEAEQSRFRWRTYPKRMLIARATCYLIRDLFSDVISGWMDTDEAMDELKATTLPLEPVQDPQAGTERAPIQHEPKAALPAPAGTNTQQPQASTNPTPEAQGQGQAAQPAAPQGQAATPAKGKDTRRKAPVKQTNGLKAGATPQPADAGRPANPPEPANPPRPTQQAAQPETAAPQQTQMAPPETQSGNDQPYLDFTQEQGEGS